MAAGIGIRTRALAGVLTVAIGALALAAPDADAGRKRGIDVSRFQGTIDWTKVGETKNEFAFIQASRGSGRDCAVAPTECGPDAFYDVNYAGAKANGLRAGAYHRAFASGKTRERARADARREAGVFARAVGKVRRRDLRPVLDVETPFIRLSKSRLILWIRTWLEKVERKTGVKPMIYTNASSWGETGDTTRFARQGYRLWVANFDVRSPIVPADDWAGRGWSIWQHTSSGRVRGIKGNVDKNKLGVRIGQISARRR